MPIEIEQLRKEIRAENRKFALQASIALAAALGVGIAIGHISLFHSQATDTT